MKDNIVRLAYSLCQIPSITNREQEVIQFLTNFLNRQNIKVDLLPVKGDPSRVNIFAYKEYKNHYDAILCTHLDTVGPFIPPRLDEAAGILHGRGSLDAKGIAAAMIYAALNQYNKNNKNIALLFTVGEEESSDGAKAANAVLKKRARYIIVGEPTNNICAKAQKGTLVFDLIAQGKMAHSSMPQEGHSAINDLIEVIHKLNSISWPNNHAFGETILNIGEISGGRARNIIADKAKAKAIMRLSASPIEIMDVMRENLQKVAIEIHSKSDPTKYYVPPFMNSFHAGFGSDAPYLQNVGKPLLVGPGSLELAHKDNEHIYFSELEQGFLTYTKIIEHLCIME